MTAIRIGIVGCGRILAAHLRGYRLLRAAGIDTFRITALCARREDDARMYVQRGSGPPQRPAVSRLPGDPLAIGDEYLSDFQPGEPVEVFTDFRRMIAEGPIDAVNDFSTHALHHQVATEAFKHGKHLLTQKPLAVSIEAGRRMCAAAESAGLTFSVFENFRHAPRTRHLLAAFGAGPLGALQMLLVGYAGLWWAPNQIVAGTPWRHSKLDAGGISLDLGVHFFDQIRSLAGEIEHVTARVATLEPRRVMLDEQGRAGQAIDCDADDTFFATAETASGTPANLFASWAGHGGPTLAGDGMAYYGQHGMASGDEAIFDDGRRVKLAEIYASIATPEQQAHDFPHGLADSFALNQLDWLQAIAAGRQSETSGAEGLRDLAAAFAILESHHAGRRIAVSDVLTGRVRAFQQPIDGRFGLA
ncbi:MAG TPA: Gfo/Idh/MocA family oxidoreductase [Pirellulales bacterium]|jgi:predicted dehydrogenase|nr:Gfo/Idh/MocA family oxidoreductase [Pirellulales bacterium]